MTNVVMELSVLEAAHLTDLVAQFADLLDEALPDEASDGAGGAAGATGDPALARLVPDAYPDDPAAAAEFRRLTEGDLLDRRRDDAATVRATLLHRGEILDPATLDPDAAAEESLTVELDDAATAAWLRTLTAVRLVLAGRLGITDDDALDDPRFGVYNWLGFRLEGLLEAIDR